MTPSILGPRYDNFSSAHDYLLTGFRAMALERITSLAEQAQWDRVSCLCGQEPKLDYVLANVDRFRQRVTTVICRGCGLMRLDPRWDLDSYIRMYSEAYWPLTAGEQVLTESRFQRSVRRAQPFVDTLTNWVQLRDKSLLEVGSSYGAGLFALKPYAPAILRGYDYDQNFLEMGRRLAGVELRHGGIDEAVATGERYDVVVLRHVFEHLQAPIEQARQIASLINPGGVLLIEVPGVLAPGLWLDDPIYGFQCWHTYSFCLETLTSIMQAAGYKRLHGNEQVFSLWQFTGQSQPYVGRPHTCGKILKYLRKLERKRKLKWILNTGIGIASRVKTSISLSGSVTNGKN